MYAQRVYAMMLPAYAASGNTRVAYDDAGSAFSTAFIVDAIFFCLRHAVAQTRVYYFLLIRALMRS